MLMGEIVFSPISHGHPIAEAVELPKDWAFWGKHCEAMLRLSHQMNYLKLPGWETSEGLQNEIILCDRWGIPLRPIEREEI